MMTNSKQWMTTGGCFLAVVLLGGLLLVWPVKREARVVRSATAALHLEIETLAGTAEQVEQLQKELEAAQRRVTYEFKNVPPSAAHIVDVMPRLSLQVDGMNVQDWSLAQGMPQRATADPDVTAMVVPLTAETKARFDSVFSVLRAAETMSDLVRISSVRMSSTGGSRPPSGQQRTSIMDDMPVVTAAIVFEAVFDPATAKEQP